MNSYKTISEYKSQAKEQLLGNYNMVVSSFVVVFATSYILISILIGAVDADNPGLMQAISGGVASQISVINYIKSEIAATVVNLVAGAFSTLLFVGYLYILLKISGGQTASASDLFYGFKNHPDKVLVMYFVLAIAQVILMIPSKIAQYYSMDDKGNIVGPMFLAWMVLYVAAVAIYIFLNIVFAFRYLIYIDDPNMDIKEYFSISKKLMKGNKLRYAYMILSMLGYWMLGILSIGIGLLWVEAYQNTAIINMYKDAISASVVRE